MTAVSTENYDRWQVVAHEGPGVLVVILLKRTYVLPWSQFRYAEGTEEPDDQSISGKLSLGGETIR